MYRSQDVSDIDDIFMLKPVENLDFSQCPLAVSLMLKGTYLLDGNLGPELVTVLIKMLNGLLRATPRSFLLETVKIVFLKSTMVLNSKNLMDMMQI